MQADGNNVSNADENSNPADDNEANDDAQGNLNNQDGQTGADVDQALALKLNLQANEGPSIGANEHDV